MPHMHTSSKGLRIEKWPRGTRDFERSSFLLTIYPQRGICLRIKQLKFFNKTPKLYTRILMDDNGIFNPLAAI